jgi:hypothetical protein
VPAKSQGAYAELRVGIEARGGRMWYEGAGWGRGGAWKVKLGTKQAVFRWDNHAFPGLDDLYVPLVKEPRYHTDYSNKLVPGAIDKLVGRLDEPDT